MGMSAAHCQGKVREFQRVWRVVTLHIVQCRIDVCLAVFVTAALVGTRNIFLNVPVVS